MSHNSQKCQKWNTKSSWNDSNIRGRVRFEIFKSQYPGAFFEYLNTIIPIDEIESWDEAKAFLGVGGINPHRANVMIRLSEDSEPIDLGELDRFDVLTDKVNQNWYELFAGIVALLDIDNFMQFIALIGSPALIPTAHKIGLEPDDFVQCYNALVDNDHKQSEYFAIAKQIRENLGDKIQDAKLMRIENWDNFRKSVCSLMETNAFPDKWNPADIVIYHQPPELLDSLEGTNTAFTTLVSTGQLFPISMKESNAGSLGSTGIQKEINQISNIEIVDMLDLLENGVNGVECVLGGPARAGKKTSEYQVQNKALQWVGSNPIENITDAIRRAWCLSDFATLHYRVSPTKFKRPHQIRKEVDHITLKRIIVPTTANSIFLELEGSSIAVVRSKGYGSTNISIEHKRIPRIITLGEAPDLFKQYYGLI